MPTYHIKFTPLEPYFFGDERSFNSDDNANYFVRSRIYPQQTTLLGALRYDLLRRNNLLQTRPGQKLSAKAANLIGAKSFQPHQVGQFGLIQSLSALQFFYRKHNKAYVQVPQDMKMHPETKDRALVKYTNLKLDAPVTTYASFSMFTKDRISDESWLAKEGTTNGLLPDEKFHAYSKPLPHSGDPQSPLLSREKVGIIKNKGGASQDDDESGFFRQQSFMMKSDWCFSLYVEMADPLASQIFDSDPISLIPVGGEKTPFQLEYAKVDP
ncbi:MAG: type III-B CRISPR module-associated Cmr3 family protein, partial [Bacteroidota bacterium]